MSKRTLSSVLAVLALTACMSSCYTLDHTVGKGAQGNTEHTKRVWFALWGLIPLGDYDSQKLAGDAKDYSIQTQWTPLDILMNIFTVYVSCMSRTVTVTK